MTTKAPDQIEALRKALNNIEELNKTSPDENGCRWDASDLIGQELRSARAALAHVNEPPKPEQVAANLAAERITLANAVFVASRTIDGDEAQAIADALIAAGWRRDSAELRVAATDVLKRWDSTDWKAAPTADVMNRLRYALRGKS